MCDIAVLALGDKVGIVNVQLTSFVLKLCLQRDSCIVWSTDVRGIWNACDGLVHTDIVCLTSGGRVTRQVSLFMIV